MVVVRRRRHYSRKGKSGNEGRKFRLPSLALQRCYLQLLQPPGTSWVLSSDSQSALLQGLLDFSGLLIWERLRLYSVMVSKRWGREVPGSGWAAGNGRARADWVREEEYLEKAKGWVKHRGCRVQKREATCVGGGCFF